MKIWLDDVRPAPDGWVWMKTAEELIDFLSMDCFDTTQNRRIPPNVTEISFDHDLGENVKSGYDAMTHLEMLVMTKNYSAPILHIHSANPVGRQRMQMIVDRLN